MLITTKDSGEKRLLSSLQNRVEVLEINYRKLEKEFLELKAKPEKVEPIPKKKKPDEA